MFLYSLVSDYQFARYSLMHVDVVSLFSYLRPERKLYWIVPTFRKGLTTLYNDDKIIFGSSYYVYKTENFMLILPWFKCFHLTKHSEKCFLETIDLYYNMAVINVPLSQISDEVQF